MFTVVDAALLRLAAQPTGTRLRPWPDLTDGDVPHWRDWVSRTWADERFARAVHAASPDLARRVDAVCAGNEQRLRQVRRTVVSLLRYRLRADWRATPFGLFAGVAPTGFGKAATVRLGDDHRATSRVDAVALAKVVGDLERCPDLVTHLPVVVNNTATLRDGRLVIGLRQHPDPSGGRTDPAEVSLRHTRVVDEIMRTARTPIFLAELADRLEAAFPGTPRPVITETLIGLIDQRVLLTGLRPPMTVTDPLGHVQKVLAEIRAEGDPAVAGSLARLRDQPGGRNAGGVDLRVDAQVVLPRSVAAEITRAADVLAQLTPHPFGAPTWRDYHARFLERYGIGAAVPMLELVDPDIGLGYPGGYRDSLLQRPSPPVTERDTTLLRLAQNAVVNRQVEITLDDAAISDLAADTRGRAQWPPHTELAVRVHARSLAALNQGDFELVVTGAFRAAGTAAGRFLDLLDAADRHRMTRAYSGLPTVNGGAQRVQVSCPPLYTETENVARHQQVLPTVLSIGEHRPGTKLTPEDLLVIGDAHRFTVWSRSTARPVEPEVFTAVEFTNFSHPLLRFACELSTARAATCGPFDWGIAGRLPFLPRLTYRRTILSSARWTLTAADLPDSGASWQDWTVAVAGWRVRAMVTAAVYLGGTDQRLRLDLDEPAHLHLLRAHLDRTGRATLHEAPAPNEFGWLDGHAHEIIVPLASTQPRTWPPLPARRAPITVSTAADGHLPGAGRWLFCKLYGHPDRHTAVLTRLPDLLGTLEESVQWWFLPYRDPDNHLRLRIRLTDPTRFGPVTAALGAWATGLRQRGLIATMQLDTYLPETGRFGHGPAMTAAEKVFAADSAAALAQRAHLSGSDAADARALTAASLVDLAAAFTGDHPTGAAWLIEHITAEPVTAPDRAVYDQALHLVDPRGDLAAVHTLPGGAQIATAWTRRQAALAAYRDTLARVGGPAPDAVLASLLHLHSVRTHGIAPDTERIAHRLARSAVLSHTIYPKGRR